jgi:hypothetical protein
MKGSIDMKEQDAMDLAPAWLREALEGSQVSSDLEERCRDAARAAYGIALLRKTSEAPLDVLDTFEQYVTGLARRAGVDLAPILRWLDLRALSQPEISTIPAYARLAQSIGIGARQLKEQVRMSLAVSRGEITHGVGKSLDGIALPVAHEREELARWESGLDSQSSNLLRVMDYMINEQYESSDE